MDWTPFIAAAGSILAAFAGASLAAHFGFKRWREQRWIERREQFAEQVLTDFYEVRNVFRWVRSPGSFGGEGETRQGSEGERPELKRLRDTYFIPIERMQANKELFARLNTARFRCMALFGEEAAEPFEKIRKVQIDIELTSEELIEDADRPQDDITKENRRKIWWRSGADDEITNAIEAAVSGIEMICRPILKAEGVRR